MSLDVYYWVNLETLMSTLSTLWGNPYVIPLSPLTPCTKYRDIHSYIPHRLPKNEATWFPRASIVE